MVMGRKLAQRQEEFRRQHQHEQSGRQSDAAAGTEADIAQQAEAHIDRDHRDRHGAEQLQHGGGQEGDAEDTHGPLAVIVRNLADQVQFSPRLTEQLQRRQTLQPIEEVSAHARQRLELPLAGGRGAHPDQRHEQRYEGRRSKQHGADHPVHREDCRQQGQGHQHRQRHLRQEAGEIAVECIDLLDQDGCQIAAVPATHIGRPKARDVAVKLATQA